MWKTDVTIDGAATEGSLLFLTVREARRREGSQISCLCLLWAVTDVCVCGN